MSAKKTKLKMSAAPLAPVPPKDESEMTSSSNVSLQAWVPDNSYINAIKKHKDLDAQYAEYISQREIENRAKSTAFFLDCANFFFTQPGGSSVGVRVLTTIGDIKLEDPRLYRLMGNKLWHEGEVANKLIKLANVTRDMIDIPIEICFIIAE